MNTNPLYRNTGVLESDKPVQDEWGLFDPQQAGAQALMGPSRGLTPTAVETVSAPDEGVRASSCPYCNTPLAPSAHRCSRCLRAVGETSLRTSEVSGGVTQAAAKAQSGAVYTLESPARCPECEQEIRTFRVLRVLRTQVSFTSTLPRKGYVIVCPECERLLSAELSGLV